MSHPESQAAPMVDVSVVIPVRNAAPHIEQLRRQCEAMVLAGPSIEFVVVDDRSTDDSADLLRAWADSADGRVRILPGAGEGVAAARNLAIEEARGEYVWFTDADDEWRPTIVAALLARARATDADIVVCNARKVSPRGADLGLIDDAPEPGILSGAEGLERLLRGSLQGHLWNKLFRRQILHATTFPPTRAHSDLGGVVGLLTRARTVALEPSALYTYVIRTGSILNSANYRWHDLPDCLDLARAAATELQVAPDALAEFAVGQVGVPLFHESVRREATLQAADIDAMRRAARSHLTRPRLVSVLRGPNRSVAARGIGITLLPRLYVRAYRRYRAREYAELDRLT